MKASISLGLLVAAFATSAQPADSQIRIDRGSCGSGVNLIARNARLSDVLEKLAQSLGFELRLDEQADSVVNLSASMPAPELITKLSWGDSVIVTQGPDPGCPQQSRVVKVWVLPKAKEAPTGRVAQTETVQEQSRKFDDMSRRAKEAYETYVRIHGKAPPGEEEEVAKLK
jgi:hypothetical protein